MSQRKFNHLFDLSQLLTTSADVIIADFIQSILLFLILQSHTYTSTPRAIILPVLSISHKLELLC